MSSRSEHGGHTRALARAVAEYLDVLVDRWHELSDDERRAAVRVASDAARRAAGGRRRR